MKVCGIVVEYNPFHNGHLHHLQQARRQSGCDVVVAVMSPHFVQRGEPAICDKWTRAKAALACGVDLVIELPTLHAVQSAAYFAQAAVELLALADTDVIVFGSESSDHAQLEEAARRLEHVVVNERSQSIVRQYESQLGAMAPNDILGIHYIRAARPYGIQTLCIKRTNDYHSCKIDAPIASATAIRHAFFHGEDVSAYTPLAAQLDANRRLSALYPYLQTQLLLDDPAKMRACFLMDEGIESLFIQAAKANDTLEAFLDHCTNARYTRSRIQRTLIHYLLHTSKDDANQHALPAHLRLLAFTKQARPLLRKLQDEGRPIVSRFHDLPLFYRQMERKATILYTHGDAKERKRLFAREGEGPYADLSDHHH
ncbi:MAG: nucleotidyltransferase family protein [Merdibacter sp.]